MKYQITAPLNNTYLKDLESMKDKSIKTMFPSVFLASTDEALLEAGVEELCGRIKSMSVFRYDDHLIHACVDARNFKQSFLQLVATLDCNSGFYNEYKGILTVDLSSFNDDYADELIALLAFLADYQKDRIYIFYSNAHCIESTRKYINQFFTCHVFNVKLEKPQQKVNYCKTLLERVNLSISQEAEPAFSRLLSAQAGAADIHVVCRDLTNEALLHGNGLVVDLALIQNYSRNHQHLETKKTSIGLIK